MARRHRCRRPRKARLSRSRSRTAWAPRSLTNGVITDVLPIGLTYVEGSATNSAEFTFVPPFNTTTRTLTWTAANVTASGTVTYKAKVNKGAAALDQPLTNIATIDSAQTAPSSDTSDVFVPVPPLAETHVPTAPPTDTRRPDGGPVGLQPPAHPGDPRSHPPGRRLRHPGPGPRSSPEPPLGPSPSRPPDPSGVSRPAGPYSPSSIYASRPRATSDRGAPPFSVGCLGRFRESLGAASLRRRSRSRSRGRPAPRARRSGHARSRSWRRGRSPSGGG